LLGQWGLSLLLAATPDAPSRLRLARSTHRGGGELSIVTIWTLLLSAAPLTGR
jgi:hypothetical protein